MYAEQDGENTAASTKETIQDSSNCFGLDFTDSNDESSFSIYFQVFFNEISMNYNNQAQEIQGIGLTFYFRPNLIHNINTNNNNESINIINVTISIDYYSLFKITHP